MTPGARIAAAIDILDAIRSGVAAEQALTGWARSSRFAGSKDRAAVRDHVFDVLRSRRSLGDGDGRSLMIALAMRDGWDIPSLFSGEGHAPAKVEPSELTSPIPPNTAAACDIPDWLWPEWSASLGDAATETAKTLQSRAPVFLRVNLRRASREKAALALANYGIETAPHPEIATCLEVTANPRRVKMADAYHQGLVELQDAASQWAVSQLPLEGAGRVLDYCAGGGGKALAIADAFEGTVVAHDIAPQRMRDLPSRAQRAGVEIATTDTHSLAAQAPFDLVFCDAPCSGSGTWRRTPDAKWQLNQPRLSELTHAQAEVLRSGADLVRSGGFLGYATCSVLDVENSTQVGAFIQDHPGWSIVMQETRLPNDHGDGFFLSVLKNNL